MINQPVIPIIPSIFCQWFVFCHFTAFKFICVKVGTGFLDFVADIGFLDLWMVAGCLDFVVGADFLGYEVGVGAGIVANRFSNCCLDALALYIS